MTTESQPSKPPKGSEVERIPNFNAHEDEFFEEGNAISRAVQSAAQDVVGRALTQTELAAIQAEVQVRLDAEKSQIRKLFERYGKSLMRTMAVLLGFSTFSVETQPTQPVEPVDQITMPQEKQIIKTATEQEAQREAEEDFMTMVELGLAAYKGTPEYYGRTGRPEWPTMERLHYSVLPTESKLYTLHPEFAEFSDQAFLEHFEELMESARTEFKHTDLRDELANGAIERFIRLAPTLEPQQTVDLYDSLLPSLQHEMGLSYTVDLRLGLQEALTADHPLQTILNNSHIADDQRLLDKSKKTTVDGQRIQRSIEFDQERGVVDVQAKVGDESILLSSFPGNGGDPRFSSRGKATKEFASTRAGTFRVKQLEQGHVSPNWPNSLIPQGAEIKQVGDDFMYQTPDGRFRYATGPKAEFMGRTPFDKDITAADRSLLISAGTQIKVDKTDIEKIEDLRAQGAWRIGVGADKVTFVVPMGPFTADDFMGPDNKPVTSWGKNDFGPRSLLYETLDGHGSQQLFHSNYLEVRGSTFLDTSHGCIHMYQDDLASVFSYIDQGDLISITAPKATWAFAEQVITVAKPTGVSGNEG